MPTRQRRRVVVDDSALARGIGARLKAARLKADLTQQQLAGDRYTKAYVSALEHGHVKPSMAALNFLSTRLGVTAHALFTDEAEVWTRLEADLRLAAGRWREAIDAYGALLQGTVEPRARAELLRGQSEALARLDLGAEAATAGAEAAEIFARLDRPVDAALASYWLAAAQCQLDNTREARAILESVLAQIRGGLAVEPDFKLRVLMALSSVESRAGQHQVALAYLEEVRGLAGQLDDRRRAHFLFDLARRTSNRKAELSNLLRRAKVQLALGDHDGALASYEEAAALARSEPDTPALRRVLADWAELLAQTGHVERAYELAREALAS